MSDAKLFRDLGKIVRRALEMLRRRARNHFEIGDLGQTREDFILHAFTKVSVVRIATEIVERQHRNRFIRSPSRTGGIQSSEATKEKETDREDRADNDDINPDVFLLPRRFRHRVGGFGTLNALRRQLETP